MRIISLVPSITEALCMLGLEDSIVGITDFCLHPAGIVDSKKRVGGTKNPRIREIMGLRPDLVLINTDENRLQTYNQLKDSGLNTLITETDSLDQVERTWVVLGHATGTLSAAVEQMRRIAAARQINRAALRELKCKSALIPVWREPWMASGPGTYMESLLSECGFRNVMSNARSKWVKMKIHGFNQFGRCSSPEKPDVILLPTEPYSFSDKNRDDFLAIGVKRENVHVVDGVLLSWWLSRTAHALTHFRLLRLQLES
jgi:iron complex transport system substrate-binding protein